ncbi:MAG: glycoside hydrolase family 16 protein [Acutalibacteraceae bacterium]|nr:glycoside hydrolase family 16 protein [Acutalibacteraceae bacterium]
MEQLKQLKKFQKPLAIILAFALIISCFVIPGTVQAGEDVQAYWTGERIKPTKGSGTLADPWRIETAEEFAYMMLDAHGGDGWEKNAVYSLMNDIYLNDISKIDWITGEVSDDYLPNIWEPTYFSGMIQGNGHMVYGMYIERNPEKHVETFGGETGAALIAENWSHKWIQITDMGMDCVYVNSPNVSGVFVACANGSPSTNPRIMMDGCYIGERVTVKGFAAGGFFGGSSGANFLPRIKNCASLTTGYYDYDSNGNRRYKAGAILGDVWGVNDEEVDNCYALTKIFGNSEPLGSCTNNYSLVKNGDNVTVISVANMQGLDVLTNEAKMPNLGGAFTPTEAFPIPTAIYNTMNSEEEEPLAVWNGKTVAPTKGSGSLADPWLIETPEEFAYMMLEANGGDNYDVNATYKLMNDIYLNDVNKINWSTGKAVDGYTPNAWQPEVFSGIILGNGHTVYGLYIEKSPETYTEDWGGGTGAALISENRANKWIQITDMGMDCVYVNSPSVAGVFVAGMNNGNNDNVQFNFSGCYIGSNVTVRGFAAGGFVGGGFGIRARISIKNCASLTASYNDNGRGKTGLIGDVWGVGNDRIDNCYSLTNIYGNNPPEGSLTNNYSATQSGTGVTKLDASNMKGTDALDSATKMANLGAGFVATEEFPYPAGFYGTLIEDTSVAGQIWNGKTTPVAKGEGTVETPYEIETAEQLAYVVSTGGGANYKLMADIYLNDCDKIDWSTGTPVEGYTPNPWYYNTAFSGTIDGNGHMVYGLYYVNTAEKSWGFSGAALIPTIANGKTATLKNLGIDKAYINAPQAVGGLFGSNKEYGFAEAEQCFLGADVTLIGYETGAFLGLDTGKFRFNNCYSLANIVRGIPGDAACDIGLLGEFYTWPSGNTDVANSSVTNCYNANCGGSTKAAPGKWANVYTVSSARFGTTITANQMQGTIFGTNRLALTDAFMATETYPVLKVFSGNKKTTWDGLAYGFEKGDGNSAETAYEITNAGQLAYAVAIGGGEKFYKITGDIYLNDVEYIDWSTGKVKEGVENYIEPISWFTAVTADGVTYNSAYGTQLYFVGTVEGNGNTVYGLLNENDGVSTIGGLFPAAKNTVVKNLKISHSYIASGRFGGALSGFFAGSVENVIVNDAVYVYGYESINHESSSVGGILGYTSGVQLKNCAFTGHISATSAVNHVYSLVGTSWATVVKAENCFGLGRQPYTVSAPAKQFDTQAAAIEYYSGLYGATNIYTDTYAKANAISYTYGANKTKGTYTAFTFTKLEGSAMKGENALSNMPALDKNIWCVTDNYPTIVRFTIADGDVDGDGIGATKHDAEIVRKAILESTTSFETQILGNATTGICDLVKLHISKPLYHEEEAVYTFAPWSGMNGAVIYYMMGDQRVTFAAQQLQKAASQRGDKATIREGLSIGGSVFLYIDESMGPAEFKTETAGKSIVISAGSENALYCAVQRFGSHYTNEYAPLVCGASDYDESITLSSGNTYSLVWNDEFYGNTLDKNKWVNSINRTKMSGFADLKLLDTEEAVFVKDGKLTLRAMEYTDPNDENIKYAVPASVHTQGTMEYRYGYAEIYAKVPFKIGTWPSFWAQSSGILGGRQHFEYGVEVDIFEIFGNENTVVPNIHKWYQTYDYNTNHNQNTTGGTPNPNGGTYGHTQLSKKDTYKFTNYANLSNEFHLYGFEWTPTEMSMYVDGYLYETIDIVNSYDKYDNMDGFQDPLFLIFNNHLFTPESTYKPNLITGYEKEHLPSDYEIDWLRIYQNNNVSGSQVYTK